MTHRYFRTGSDEVYEQTRAALDAAWGIEAPQTCIEPAATAPRAADGRILLAVDEEFCGYAAAAEMLPALLAGGFVEEIDETTYWASVPKSEVN
jgi:hypothetical protein